MSESKWEWTCNSLQAVFIECDSVSAGGTDFWNRFAAALKAKADEQAAAATAELRAELEWYGRKIAGAGPITGYKDAALDAETRWYETTFPLLNGEQTGDSAVDEQSAQRRDALDKLKDELAEARAELDALKAPLPEIDELCRTEWSKARDVDYWKNKSWTYDSSQKPVVIEFANRVITRVRGADAAEIERLLTENQRLRQKLGPDEMLEGDSVPDEPRLDECDKLKAENDTLKANVERLTSERDHWYAAFTDEVEASEELNKAVTEARAERDKLKAEIDRLTAQLQNLRDGVDNEAGLSWMDTCKNLTDENLRYKAEIERLRIRGDNWRGVVGKHLAEIERLKAALKTATEANSARVGYWVWQGDGTDHLESLTCPILISANDMRKILAEVERLQKQYSELVEAAGGTAGESTHEEMVSFIGREVWRASYEGPMPVLTGERLQEFMRRNRGEAISHRLNIDWQDKSACCQEACNRTAAAINEFFRGERPEPTCKYYLDTDGEVWRGPTNPDDNLHYGRFEGFRVDGGMIWVARRSAAPEGVEIPEAVAAAVVAKVFRRQAAEMTDAVATEQPETEAKKACYGCNTVPCNCHLEYEYTAPEGTVVAEQPEPEPVIACRCSVCGESFGLVIGPEATWVCPACTKQPDVVTDAGDTEGQEVTVEPARRTGILWLCRYCQRYATDDHPCCGEYPEEVRVAVEEDTNHG